MPLIQITHNSKVIDDILIAALVTALPAPTAQYLTCTEGGQLSSTDIMIKVLEFGPFDTNHKDLEVFVFAHLYPSRLEKIDEIRRSIQRLLLLFIPNEKVSWCVWLFLSPTSYGSDTEPE